MSLILDAVKATIPESHYQLPLEKVGTFAFVTTVKSRRLGVCMTLSDDRIFEFKVHLPVMGGGGRFNGAASGRNRDAWTQKSHIMD
jgi:hypothetical protein